MNKYKEYVLGVLTERELLEQLTEEAAEMQFVIFVTKNLKV